jgi:hypothetical protein
MIKNENVLFAYDDGTLRRSSWIKLEKAQGIKKIDVLQRRKNEPDSVPSFL